jgi:hypothetical protein
MNGCYLTQRPLADMHGDGVYFNIEQLKQAEASRAAAVKKSNPVREE